MLLEDQNAAQIHITLDKIVCQSEKTSLLLKAI